MNKISQKLSPSATKLIRMDHTHVISNFHRYEMGSDPKTKQASVNANCLLLEIHTQIEEEFFYPALRAVVGAEPVLKKSVPEHDELRQLIAKLRSMEPTNASYDRTYMELMRKVLHHVADEETVLLPEAELLLANRLHEIGAQMMTRRMQLMARHAGQLVTSRVRAQPAKSMLIAAGAVLVGTLLSRHRFFGQSASKQAETSSTLFSAVSSAVPSMTSERASFKLGQLLGKGREMGRELLRRKRVNA